MEGLATSAERDSIKFPGEIHAKSKIKFFLGVISVVLNGNFVEIIENNHEGMCRVRDIKLSYY
jgi:hypothetical protein